MIPQTIKDAFEVIAWGVGALGVIGALVQILHELRANRRQHARDLEQRELERAVRSEDLRWRRAEAAKRLIDELFSWPDSASALRMLDWPGDRYAYETETGTQHVRVTRESVRSALTVPKSSFTSVDQFICRSFDALFWMLALLEHHITTGLIAAEDVSFPADYYVDLLARDHDVVVVYLRYYGLRRAETFLNRFPSWSLARHSPDPLPGFNDAFAGTVIGTTAGAPDKRLSETGEGVAFYDAPAVKRSDGD